jgi:FAD dependent oxidoreductase
MKQKYDVVIVGAGTAGCIAAIQAARAGAKTLLLEKNSAPGGTMTIGRVAFPGLFHAWGEQVISGIGWEMIEKCVKESDGIFPDFSNYKQAHWQLQVKINPFLYGCLIEEEFIKAGVDVLYHVMPFRVEERSDNVSLSLCGKCGTIDIEAKKIIDATADANIVSLAGYEVLFNQEKQPATPMVHLGGYNYDKLNLELIDSEYRKAVSAGSMLDTDTGMSGKMSRLLRVNGENAIHIPIDNASTSDSKTNAEKLGRQAVLRIYRFLKQFDGLKQITIEWMAQECGIRETAVIKGMKCISVDDYTNGVVYDDSICYSFYPIDLHLNTAEGLDCRPLANGVVPTIPLRALIPDKSKHIIVAGRCVSSDQLANSALRVQASCMAMGQAAACIAVAALNDNNSISDVNIDVVKSLLKEHNAIVP